MTLTTRFAPAPTGFLHLGHVASALWVWGVAGALGARVLLRIEDHDRDRSRPEYETALLEDLEWLGFVPDAPPVRQSDRGALYQEALERLTRAGLVYPCTCSRRQIVARIPRGPGEEILYPGTCRDRGLALARTPARRLRLAPGAIAFEDGLLGPRVQVPSEQCGDLLIRDRRGHWTYQLAVVVDDLEQGVDLVVRGEDLLDSTGRQIQLGRLLGRAEPARFLHHPLILGPDGAKLSKSRGDLGVRELRAAGRSPGEVLGAAAAAVGLVEAGGTVAIADLHALVGERLATLGNVAGSS